MEKKTILALILIMLVFWISNEFLWKPKAVKNQDPNNVATTEKVDQETEPVKTIPQSTTTENMIEEIVETDIEINNDLILENDKMTVTFSNKGAVITSIVIKDYTFKETGQPVQLIPVDQELFDLELSLDNGNSFKLANRVFNYEFTNNFRGITFNLPLENGFLTKTFLLKDFYDLSASIKTQSLELDSYTLNFDSGIADTEEHLIKHPKEKLRDYKLISQINNEIVKFSLSKLKEQRTETGTVDWLALRSKYFILGLSMNDLVTSEKLFAFNNQTSPAANVKIGVNRSSIENNFELYFGPLIGSYLKEFRPGFEKNMEGPFLEILRPIANLFNWVFKQMIKVIPNYGLIVIIIAIILKILLYPLTHKSYESTQGMQRINPLMKEIQKKYKDNPKKMNAELKNLYKEHGVSPLGGCLPMLLQMPIIFAIYPVIRYSLDMRQTSFLWLPDLSEPDQLLILPIAMAIFMFVQQKLMSPPKNNVAEMDEKQQAAMQSQKMMMYFMPVMMFFIFKSLSSGLVLYWTVFSIIGTIQQYFIKKKFN